ncbi:MAG: 7-cyano-7-deazaguanine synthase, partial [Eubacteriales bacterium]|nr:7-cyano-7-deazaguanine synthase [Eubacteriales bacterium]
IPFFSVKENDAAYLSIGLQFDVSNYYVYNERNESIQEYDLMETYGAIKKFEELLRYLDLKQFNIIEPLASVTSFAIYEILRREYGDEQLKQMGSCWTPQQNGSPCGKCLKCQRVAYIYNALGLKLSEHEKESLKLLEESNVPLAYLFGSITCEKLLCKYDASELKHMLFIDDKVFDLDKGIHKDISEIYGLKIIENPLKPVK